MRSNPYKSIFKGRYRKGESQVLFAIAFIYLVLWILIPKPSFWGVDNGFKYQGMRSIAERGSLLIPYKGIDVDPSGQLRSIMKPFGVLNGNGQIPVFSAIFMLIGGVFYFVFGKIGPWLIPLFGGWLTLFAAWLMWVRHKRKEDGRLFLVMLGFGSPLLFYSLTLWEHSLAMACVILAFSLVARSKEETNKEFDIGNSIIAAIFLTLAVMLRTESVIWIPIVIMFWKFTKRSWTSGYVFLFVSIIGLSLVLLINKLLTGTSIPLHVLSNMAGYRYVGFRGWNSTTIDWSTVIKSHIQVFYSLLFEGFGSNIISVIGLLPLLVVALWRKWRRNRLYSIIAAAVIFVAGAVYLMKSGVSNDRISYTMSSGGLLWVVPFAALGIRHLRSRNRGFWKLVWISPLMYIVFVLVWAPLIKGVHWGPRLGLEILPFMLVTASLRAYKWWRNDKSTRAVIVILAALSVINQFYSFDMLLYARNDNAKLNAWTEAMRDEVVLTNVRWLSGECAIVSDLQEWYYTPREENVNFVVSNLRKRGLQQFVFYEIEPLIQKDKWDDIGVEIMGTQEFVMTGIRTKYTYYKSLCRILPGKTEAPNSVDQ